MRKKELEKLLYKTVAEAIGVEIDERSLAPKKAELADRSDRAESLQPQRAAA